MKRTTTELQLGKSAQKMAGFLVIKMLDAQATGDKALAEEISNTLHEAGVSLTRLPSGAVSFVVGVDMAAPFKGAVFPPPANPNAEAPLGERFDKLQKVCDFMAVHYHTLHQTCTALLARAGAGGPPYAQQVAVYRELRRDQLQAIENAVKPRPTTHSPSRVIKPETPSLVGINGTELVDLNGKKVH